MNFPLQNIPESKKNEEWHLECLNAIVFYAGDYQFFRDDRLHDHENFLITEGRFDPKQYEYLTDMYGITSPARLVNYPLIMPKLDLLVGELVSQPLQYTVNVINRDALNRKNEAKISAGAEVLMRPVRRKMEKILGTRLEDQEVAESIPDDIEKFMNTKFRDHIEEQVDIGLEYCINKWRLKDVFARGFLDLCITRKSFYRVYIKNGDPYVERLDPRCMIYDIDAETESLSNANYVAVCKYYTINEILDRYKLSKKQADKLEELRNMEQGFFMEANRVFENYIDYENRTTLKVAVIDAQWKSIRMMKFREKENPYDKENPYLEMLPDDYKPKKGEKIVEKAVTDIRQATRIGEDTLIEWGRKPNQIRYEDNYANTQLDFFGIVKNGVSGPALSVVDTCKNIQIFYNIVMYHIELALARSGGKAVVYDVSQKPNGMSYEDVMYHLKNSGILPINSKQEGNQINSFNQFQQIDLTLSQSVANLINLKAMLEDTMDRLTGISAARAGITKSGDLVGVNERNVMQSSLITARLYDIHYRCVGDVLQGVANMMKMAWGNGGKMVNVYGDTGMQFFKIDDAIALDEYGIFIENSGKEVNDKNIMMQILNQAAANGTVDLLPVIQAVRADSATEVEYILKKGLEGVQAIQNQLKEREVAAMEQANKIAQEKNQIDIQKVQIPAQATLQKTQMDNQTKVEVQKMKNENDRDLNQADRVNKLDEIMLNTANKEEKTLT